MSSNELFYRDNKGEKRDAELHEELLQGCSDPEALLEATRERALAAGLSPKTIKQLYPSP